MTPEEELLEQIPVNWFDQMDQQEVARTFAAQLTRLMEGMAKNLELEGIPTLEMIAEKTGGTLEEITDELHWHAFRETRVYLFQKQYAEILPKDPKGGILLTEAVYERATGKKLSTT
jgi:hypothetical protein